MPHSAWSKKKISSDANEKTPNQRPAVRISDHESATTNQRPSFANQRPIFANQRPIFANQRPHVNQRPQSSESATTILRISDHMWESATANQRPHARNSLCTRSGYLQPAIHGRKLETKPRRRSEMEKVRREKMQVREKVGKSRNTVFFQCFVAPEGRKLGSLKRRARSEAR